MEFDVVVIGAGPAGAAITSMLTDSGYRTAVLEKSVFPRFVIGERTFTMESIVLQG